MLKLTRKTQQGVVVYPKDDKQNALVIRVVDIVPNSVSLGFEGDGFEVVRSEIFNGGFDTDEQSKLYKLQCSATA